MLAVSDAIVSSTVSAPLLAGLFADPALNGDRMVVAAGDVLHAAEDAAEDVFFIHRGQVRIYHVTANDSVRLLEILGPHDWFGMAALARTGTYGARAMAVEASVVSRVRADRLLAALQSRPEILVELNRDLASRVMAAREEASRLVFEDCNQRLIRTLIRFAGSAASRPRGDGVVLHITHSQLAQAVGVARETVSLALTQLRHRNLLRTGRNQLYFNPDQLRRNGMSDARPAAPAASHAHGQVEQLV